MTKQHKKYEDYVDDAVHAALYALGLSAENVPDFADSLSDWLLTQVPYYISNDEEET